MARGLQRSICKAVKVVFSEKRDFTRREGKEDGLNTGVGRPIRACMRERGERERDLK